MSLTVALRPYFKLHILDLRVPLHAIIHWGDGHSTPVPLVLDYFIITLVELSLYFIFKLLSFI